MKPSSGLVESLFFLFSCVPFLTGCGSGSAPEDPISDLFLEVSTPESDPTRWLLLVGESGSARLVADTKSGCLGDAPCSVPVEVKLSSSAPGVLRVGKQVVRTPGSVPLIAIRAGTAEVTATAQGLTRSARVDVVTTPLPIDSMRLSSGYSPFDQAISMVHDQTGNLVEMTLPVLGYAALRFQIFRGDQVVLRMPWTIESSDPAVAWVHPTCRALVVDADCSIASSWGWVTGLSAGSATVTVTERNLQRSFAVIVQ